MRRFFYSILIVAAALGLSGCSMMRSVEHENLKLHGFDPAHPERGGII